MWLNTVASRASKLASNLIEAAAPPPAPTYDVSYKTGCEHMLLQVVQQQSNNKTAMRLLVVCLVWHSLGCLSGWNHCYVTTYWGA